MAFVNEKPMGPEGSKNWRTIDYERDAILKSLGSEPGKYSRGGGWKFELTWRGMAIPFTLDSRKEATPEGNLNYFWELQRITIPENYQQQREEIYQLILEAVTEWGFIYNRARANEVHVDFKKFEKAASITIN